MKTKTIIVLALFSSLLVFLLFGCTPRRKQTDIITAPEQTSQLQSDTTAQRFQEPDSRGQTAVESAIELSRKYAILSEQAASQREKNKDLATENYHLKEQVNALDVKLKQTQKELKEANDLLIEMLAELNNWKTSILGFRDEMREAQKAQLEALLKVLEILGGEVEARLLPKDVLNETDTLKNKANQGRTGNSENETDE